MLAHDTHTRSRTLPVPGFGCSRLGKRAELRREKPPAVGGGRVAEVFIAETVGYTNTTDLTPEDLAAHWAEVTSQDGYAVPATIADETALFLAALS